jgi:phospholipid/cholesterol/gamma-HCH transport system substrate-binding protein
MEPNARYMLVGVSVAVVFTSLIAAILWMATSGFSKEDDKTFVIYFKQHSLAGLQIDSPVTMKGIKIGRVADFSISKLDIQKIKVIIKIEKYTPVRVDTEAVISRNLLTGLANIDLVHGTQDSPPLEEPGKGEKYPVINEGASELQAVTESLPDTLHGIQDAITKISQIFSDDNQKNIAGILDDVHKVTGAVAENDKAISAAVQNFASFFKDTGENTNGLKKEFSDTLKAVRVAAESFTQQSSRLGEQFSRTARSVTQATDKLSNPTSILRGPKSEELGPGEEIKK